MKRYIRATAAVLTAAMLITSLPAVNNLQASATAYPDSAFYPSLDSAKAAWEEYATTLPSDEFNISYDCDETNYDALLQYISERTNEMNEANYFTLNEYLIYCSGNTSTFGTTFDENDNMVSNVIVMRDTPQFELHGTLSEIRDAAATAESIASQWGELSTYEQIMAISRWICENTEYDDTLSNHSLGSCINEGFTVCDGYAQTFQVMAESLGIESYIMTGELDGGPHAWNVVKLDGNWYFVDVTNADQYVFDDRQILFGSEYASSGEFAHWTYTTALDISRSDYTPTSGGDSPVGAVEINDTNFPDSNFRDYISTMLDTNSDGVLSVSEIKSVRSIDVRERGISSLEGIEYFYNLDYLECYNNQLTSLDVSSNTALTQLRCEANQLTSIDVSDNANLEIINCYNNQITSLDLSGCTSLLILDCDENQLTSLDISSNMAIKTLYCAFNLLTSLDVSSNTELETLYCNNNQLSSIDVSRNTKLKLFGCSTNQLASIDVSSNTSLERFWCDDNQLTSIDVSSNTALTVLNCSSNQLTSLDVSSNTVLELLECKNNQITSLDVSNNTKLDGLVCDSNPLTSLDVSNNTLLDWLDCMNTQLTSLDISNNTLLTSLDCRYNQITSLDVSQHSLLMYLACENNQITSLDVSNLTNLLGLGCADNQISSLDVSNSTELTSLDFANNQIDSIDVSNNTELRHLNCSGNLLTSVDVSNNTDLTYFDCDNNQLTSIDVSNNTALEYFNCSGNQITSIDVSNNVALVWFSCDNNKLTRVDVTNNIALEKLECISNQITSLDVSNNTGLLSLSCSCNQLTSLDVSSNTALEYLDCGSNQITSLDVSNNTALVSLYCTYDQLTNLNVSNNPELSRLHCFYNQLTNLDVSGCTELTELSCENNQLIRLDVSDCNQLVYLCCIDNPLEYLDTGDNTPSELYYPEGTILNGIPTATSTPTPTATSTPSATPSPIPTEIPSSGVDGFITRLYSEVFGRDADQGGINYWVDQLNNGTTGGDAARFFLCSEEFLNKAMSNEEFVGVLYAVFFDRTPDAGGLNYWMSEVTSKGKEDVINSLIASQEWANICESYGIATGAGGGNNSDDPIVAFAERLYTTCLGRAGEQGGIDFWSAELRAGRTNGSSAARGFFFGAEFTNAGISNTEYVKRLYRTFFGREADSAGLNYWLGELSKNSRGDVFNMFTGCQEWLDACAAAGIQP